MLVDAGQPNVLHGTPASGIKDKMCDFWLRHGPLKPFISPFHLKVVSTSSTASTFVQVPAGMVTTASSSTTQIGQAPTLRKYLR